MTQGVHLEEQTPLEELIFALFDQCPSWCDYCFNAKNIPSAVGTSGFTAATAKLAVESIKRTIEQALPLGLKAIQISGGEPLLDLALVADVVRFAQPFGHG